METLMYVLVGSRLMQWFTFITVPGLFVFPSRHFCVFCRFDFKPKIEEKLLQFEGE